MSSRRMRTSESHPIRVDFVGQETLGLPGRLGMTICPGVKDPGRWYRDLGTDLDQLRRRHHADVLITLLEREEFERYGVPDLLERSREVGLEVVHFPITDVSTPRKAQSEEYAAFVQHIVDLLRGDKTVVVHCRGGLGRTGTVAASVLVALGHTADEAIDSVRRIRSERAVETREQEEYVRRFEEEWRADRTPGEGKLRREEPTQVERYRGSLLGLAVGDALGTTLEFKPPGTFRPVDDMVGGGPFGLEAGQWTDDTSMALCLAESLIERRRFDPADQLRRYVRWYREGHMSSTGVCFDIGNATRQALERFEKTGEPYSGSRDPKIAGNGSIMRLAPVPLFYARVLPYRYHSTGPVEAIERSGESSRTTHGAQNAVDACRYLGALIAGAVNGAEKEDLLSERFSPVGSGYWEKWPLAEEVNEVAAGSFKRKQPPEIRGRGYVVASLEAALWAFYSSKSFREGALLAINLGDDTDTTGAVYGQLAGAYYGERAIPGTWRSKLAYRLLIEYFAERLYHLGETVDWDRLLAYLPTFEREGFEFAREVTSPGYALIDPETDSRTEMPFYDWSPEVHEFHEALYSAGVILPYFDWSSWHEEAKRFVDAPRAIEEADELTLRRLLTAHARAERFSEGHFVEMLKSGHITAILRRLKELNEERR